MKIRKRDQVHDSVIERVEHVPVGAVELPRAVVRVLHLPGPQLSIALIGRFVFVGGGHWTARIDLGVETLPWIASFQVAPTSTPARRAWVCIGGALVRELRDGSLWLDRPPVPCDGKPLAYLLGQIARVSYIGVRKLDLEQGIALADGHAPTYFDPKLIALVITLTGGARVDRRWFRGASALDPIRCSGKGFEAVIAPRRPPFKPYVTRDRI